MLVSAARFPGLAYPEEELAAALAHEFAHNWLAPQRNGLLDSLGRKRRQTSALTEREADRLMTWIIANAGYRTPKLQCTIHEVAGVPKHEWRAFSASRDA